MKKVYKNKVLQLITLTVIVTLLVVLAIGQIIAATTPEPGSNEDPIVTKSYVDAKISEALSNITVTTTENSNSTGTTSGSYDSVEIEELQEQIDVLENALNNFKYLQNSEIANLNAQLGQTTFNVVQAFDGQRIYLGEGTECILRYGTATAFPGQGGDLTDISEGLNKGDGSNIYINHLLVSSRDDGRGILITSETAWILIKGAYSVN